MNHMLQSKALAAKDMRWRWVLRTVIIGSNSLIRAHLAQLWMIQSCCGAAQ